MQIKLRRRGDAAWSEALPDVLERVAGGLRAGAAPLMALAEAVSRPDLPERVSTDLRLLVKRAETEGLEPALAAWACERQLPAVSAAAGALAVTATAGGPASPALDGLAAGLRDRHDAVDEVVALSAQARLSAIVVGAGPIVSLALSLAIDPRVAAALVGTPSGRTCLLAGLTMEFLAATWMRRIVRSEP